MNAEQIARALGGKRAGRQWKCRCPAHNDHDPSMIVFDGKTCVQFRCMSGCSSASIVAALRAQGLNPERWGEHSERASPAVEQNNNHALAVRIWDGARDPHGTPAESYLAGRDLVLPPSSALRFHPACPFDGMRVPALVALMCEIETGRPTAVQRLRLDPASNRKVDAKMLGPASRAAMMLTPWADTFADCMGFCPRLYVCEGCETGIALINSGYAPVWALGSAGAIERLPVLFGVAELVICADHDPLKQLNDGRQVRPGIEAAVACRDRWNASAHQRAEIWLPATEGQDFADWVRAKHGREHAAA